MSFEKLKITNFVKTYQVYFSLNTYVNNNTLAVSLLCDDGEYYDVPYMTISKNLGIALAPGWIYVDENNNPGITDWLVSNKLGVCSGSFGYSGYCKYPLFKFDYEELMKYTKYKRIESSWL